MKGQIEVGKKIPVVQVAGADWKDKPLVNLVSKKPAISDYEPLSPANTRWSDKRWILSIVKSHFGYFFVVN